MSLNPPFTVHGKGVAPSMSSSEKVRVLLMKHVCDGYLGGLWFGWYRFPDAVLHSSCSRGLLNSCEPICYPRKNPEHGAQTQWRVEVTGRRVAKTL